MEKKSDSDENTDGTSRKQLLRRSYLKGIGAISTTALVANREVSAAKGSKTEVVTLRNSDGPVKTRQVPKRWKQHTETAHKVRDSLEEQFLRKEGIVRVGIGQDETATGRLLNKTVEIGIIGGSTEHDIPERVNGVPVRVSKYETGVRFTGCYDKEYSTAKGGVSVGGTVCAGSAFARGEKDGTEYLLTARHIFNTDCSGCKDGGISHEGKELTQTQGGDRFGVVKDGSVEHDMVAVKPDSDEDIDNGIVDESAQINGWITKSGYDTYSSDGTVLNGRADEMCTKDFTVKNYDESISCSSSNIIVTEQAKLNGLINNGDSGGIVYFVSDKGNAFVGNILSGDNGSDRSFGAAAYAMNNLDGYSFG